MEGYKNGYWSYLALRVAIKLGEDEDGRDYHHVNAILVLIHASRFFNPSILTARLLALGQLAVVASLPLSA